MSSREAQEEAGINAPVGETLSVLERVIVAPSTGIFRRLASQVPASDGDRINRGDVIGAIQSLGASTPVQSPFEGLLIAVLAFEGERVRPGQAVAWVRVG